jgi:hypothetical protein
MTDLLVLLITPSSPLLILSAAFCNPNSGINILT